VERIHADALTYDWGQRHFDLVVGNPPFLSQMSATTTRGGSSAHGGGPYADAAAEFLALAVRLADPRHGCVGLVLPQSILGSRDTRPVRQQVLALADLTWSWWQPRQRLFDAAVSVCAVGLRRPSTDAAADIAWTQVVTGPLGVPDIDLDDLACVGRIGDRFDLNANFRDEYYALVPAVTDGGDGPPLVTSGLIDPGVCHWGTRPVTFAKRQWQEPRVELDRLHGRFPRWAERKLVPKVLVANQTRAIEAVADQHGRWLPGVPVTTITPIAPTPRIAAPSLDELVAVLTSPVATAIAWHLVAGTGLTTTSIRIRPGALAEIAWPAGALDDAVAALTDGDVVGCGAAVSAAYGLSPTAARPLLDWWAALLPN
jgi:hypothetical protein